MSNWCSLPWTPSDLTVSPNFYSAVISWYVVKIGCLDIEKKGIRQPDKISVRSGQENWLFKGVVQARVSPVLTKEHVNGEILQYKHKGFLWLQNDQPFFCFVLVCLFVFFSFNIGKFYFSLTKCRLLHQICCELLKFQIPRKTACSNIR